jgi:WD40 repeat protein
MSVRFWNPETGKPRLSIKFKEILYSCAFTPDGKQLLVAGGEEFQGKDNSVKVIDLATKKAEAPFKGHTSSIWALAVTADGKTMLKAGKDVMSVAISPDGKTLAGGGGSSVTLYAVK